VPQNPGFFFGGLPDVVGGGANFFSSTGLAGDDPESVPAGSPNNEAGLRSFFLPKPEKMLSESLLIAGSTSLVGANESVGESAGAALDSELPPTPNILATVSQEDLIRDGDSTFGVAG